MKTPKVWKMKTTRSRKAVSNMLAAVVIFVVVVLTIYAAYIYLKSGTDTSHSNANYVPETGPSVLGKSGSRDNGPPVSGSGR